MNRQMRPAGECFRAGAVYCSVPRRALWFGAVSVLLAVPAKATADDNPAEILSDASVRCVAPLGWRQPESTGLGGYEGYCGQKSVANILLFEGKTVLPKDVASVCYDATPGTRPDTLLKCLNDQSEKVWHACDARCLGIVASDYNQNSAMFLKILSSRLAMFISSHGPIIAFTQESAMSYHWQVVTSSGANSILTMESRRDKASYRNVNPRQEFAEKWRRGDGLLFPYLFFYTDKAPPVWTGSEYGCKLIGNKYFAEAVESVSTNP